MNPETYLGCSSRFGTMQLSLMAFIPVHAPSFSRRKPKASPNLRSPIRSLPQRNLRVICSSPLPRRDFMALSTAALVSVVAQQPSAPAVAAPGLHLFPLREHLMNTYYLMRACETVSDARQIISSNPVDKLSVRLHGLTPAGVEQARGASTALADAGVGASAWLWPSVTMSAFETAEILAYCLNIRREQIVPEFSFLDARGVGRLDGGRESDVRRVIAQNDRLDSNWRPTPGEDGTPNDSTEDVFVRVRQLLSKLETQYEGESIVILAPDSDPLSILQAAMTGVDLRSHHQCEFMPGEIRYVKELVVDSFGNVTDQSEAKTLFKPT